MYLKAPLQMPIIGATIELCLETFKWAIFRKNQREGGIKVHTPGILSDAIGYMNGELTRGKYSKKVR